MKKKILGLVGLLGASAVASMCVIPHANYNEEVALQSQSVELNNPIKRAPMEDEYFITRADSFYWSEWATDMSITVKQGELYVFPTGFSSVDVNDGDYLGDYFVYTNSTFGGAGHQIRLDIEQYYGSQGLVFFEGLIGKRVAYAVNDCRIDISGEALEHFGFPNGGYYVRLEQTGELDLQAPSIDGTNNFVVNVNNMLSKEEILSHITAIDDTDGVVDVVIDSTTYNPDNRQVGDYTMNVSATDRAGNKATATIKIKVVDIDKPTISGTNSYTVEYDAPVSLETIKGALTVSDNYDTGLQLQLIQDNYTGHEREVGAHTITFKATDSSGNQSDVYTVTVNVQDTKKPVISAPGKITVPTNTLLTLEELKAKISITDGLDGPITEYEILGYENYQTNYRTVGNYTITINVKDANNNAATATITITTEDKIAPEIWFDDYFIVLGQGEELTEEMIRQYASKVLGISLEAIAEVSGDYNTNELGVYKMSVKTITGEAYTFSLFVDEQTHPEIIDLDWWDKIWKGLSVAFGIENGYRADGFFDWFGDIPERFGLCWDIWSTGKMEVRTGTLPEKEESTPVVDQVVSDVAFKNKMLVDEYVVEF